MSSSTGEDNTELRVPRNVQSTMHCFHLSPFSFQLSAIHGSRSCVSIYYTIRLVRNSFRNCTTLSPISLFLCAFVRAHVRISMNVSVYLLVYLLILFCLSVHLFVFSFFCLPFHSFVCLSRWRFLCCSPSIVLPVLLFLSLSINPLYLMLIFFYLSTYLSLKHVHWCRGLNLFV